MSISNRGCGIWNKYFLIDNQYYKPFTEKIFKKRITFSNFSD
jgi:hypothetical protein